MTSFTKIAFASALSAVAVANNTFDAQKSTLLFANADAAYDLSSLPGHGVEEYENVLAQAYAQGSGSHSSSHHSSSHHTTHHSSLHHSSSHHTSHSGSSYCPCDDNVLTMCPIGLNGLTFVPFTFNISANPQDQSKPLIFFPDMANPTDPFTIFSKVYWFLVDSFASFQYVAAETGFDDDFSTYYSILTSMPSTAQQMKEFLDMIRD